MKAEPCPECGHPRKEGEVHSCIDAKADMVEAANKVTDEFDTADLLRKIEDDATYGPGWPD